MICRWCKADNGKTGNTTEARFCPDCRRYSPDESVIDAAAWCDRCGYTGPETICPNCGPVQLPLWQQAQLREAMERMKRYRRRKQSPDDDDVPF